MQWVLGTYCAKPEHATKTATDGEIMEFAKRVFHKYKEVHGKIILELNIHFGLRHLYCCSGKQGRFGTSMNIWIKWQSSRTYLF